MAAEIEVQRALYNALTALGLRVYDAAPQVADGGSMATYPYVEIGTIVLTDFDTKEVNGFDFVARLHTRSRSGSKQETEHIQGQMYGRLHYGELTITGQSLILLRRELTDVERAADGSFHGICEYRGLIEAT